MAIKLHKISIAIILLSFIASNSLFAQNPDISILRSLNSANKQPTDHFFQFVSNSNNYFIMAIPAGMGLKGLINHDTVLFHNACLTVYASAINLGVTLLLKYAVNRQRPYISYGDITKKSDGGSPSFPSGHTSGAFATAVYLSLAYPKWYVIIPSLGWATMVAYSRMDLGVHYPSDVLVGAIIGAGSAWLTYVINRKLHPAKPDKRLQFE